MNPATKNAHIYIINMSSHRITSILHILIIALLSVACGAKGLRTVSVGCEQPDLVKADECATKCCTGKCQKFWGNDAEEIGTCEGVPTN
jgi:hypothetical protein